MDSNDFKTLVDYAMAQGRRAHMRPVIEKELLHYDILFSLNRGGLLDRLTFQGGTALRLCYGAPRFSEDLDFVGGSEFTAADMTSLQSNLEDYIGKRYFLDVSVRPPREADAVDVNVDKWQLSIVTAPGRPDLPRQRVKIEVANVPAYTREPRALRHNYDFLPDGYSDTLVLTETLSEIMADKLVSLVACRRYVRYRDIWDLRWLAQQGIGPDTNLVRNKIADYRVREYKNQAKSLRQRLPEIVHGKAFRDTLTRFIPADVQERTLLQPKFNDFLVLETRRLLDETLEGLTESRGEQPFQI